MKRIKYVLVLLTLLLFSQLNLVRADELDDITHELTKLTRELEQSRNATKPLEEDLTRLRGQLEGIKRRITTIENDIGIKEKQIDTAEKALSEKKDLIEERIHAHYKNMKKAEASLLDMLVSTDLTSSLQNYFYQKKAADNDKQAIVQLILYIKNIDDAKQALSSEKSRLSQAKATVDEQSQFLSGEVGKAKQYQTELTGKIAELSARQQEIVKARSGGFIASIGDSELADDYNASIKGFRESAPGGSFAVFSFGAHTHRKGMSQYGARGRAQAGQGFKQILQAYYGKEPVNKDTSGNIKVSGHGEIDFETTYLYGIAEMPSSWHPEALKAQAVAARTYAFRYKAEGKEICTTEACQVFNKSKSDSSPQSWRDAVDQTKGQVLEDVVTYYASTHGGFASPIGWDTTDGNSGSNFIDKAYDKLGGSPWLYKSWYTKGYSASSDKCGRSSPWLSGEELADIVNAAIALNTPDIDTSRITPVTTSCWGGNPYSMAELRDLVSGKGGISSASSASVSQGNGSTNNVNINGVSLSGADFKRAFNLRAPGYLSIPQSSFAFFNIESK